MSYPLTANPHRHFYTSRKGKILGIVLHVTAGLEDFTPPDSGAEATVSYGRSNNRPASWHGIVDSDSIIDCLPDSYTGFHCINYNSSTLGLEIANRNAKWAGKPDRWVEATLANAAKWCRPRVTKYGLPVQLANRAQVDAAVRAGRPFGFTYHRFLDPKRRIDPGFDFPWTRFATLVRGDDNPVVAAPGVPAPPYPLPKGHLIGPNPKGRVTWHDGSGSDKQGHSAITTWQRQMVARGWKVGIDGFWGEQCTGVLKAFQAEKGLTVDGVLGPQAWAAAWSAPTTP